MNDDGTATGSASDEREPAFETVLDELERLVRRLETGNLSLSESLAAFERGTDLARCAEERLAAAEQRVEVLVQGGAGAPTRRPFAEQYPDAAGASADDE